MYQQGICKPGIFGSICTVLPHEGLAESECPSIMQNFKDVLLQLMDSLIQKLGTRMLKVSTYQGTYL